MRSFLCPAALHPTQVQPTTQAPPAWQWPVSFPPPTAPTPTLPPAPDLNRTVVSTAPAKMPVLYHGDCTRVSTRVLQVAVELGIGPDALAVRSLTFEQLLSDAGVVAMNPQKRLPALLLSSGAVVLESGAIVSLLLATHPGGAATGKQGGLHASVPRPRVCKPGTRQALSHRTRTVERHEGCWRCCRKVPRYALRLESQRMVTDSRRVPTVREEPKCTRALSKTTHRPIA